MVRRNSSPASAYLTVCDANITPPVLRLKEGNVLVKLSPHPDDHILLHSSMLKRSQYFDAMFSFRFAESTKQVAVPYVIEHERLDVWTYSLVQQSERDVTWLLERTDNPAPELPDPNTSQPQTYEERSASQNGYHFHDSDYSNGLDGYKAIDHQSDGISKPTWTEWARRYSVRDHKALFCFLYGISVDFSQASMQEAAMCIANVTAYAQFYGLVEGVAARVSEALTALPGVWKDIAENPGFYIGLAYKLHCQDVYADAIRHFVGSNQDYTDLLNRLRGLEDKHDKAHLMVLSKRVELDQVKHAVEKGLRKLTLPHFPGKDKKGNFKKWIPTTFLRTYQKRTENAEGKYNGNLFRAKNEHLARALFGEWLSDKLDTGNQGITLRQVSTLLCDHAARDDISLFNYGNHNAAKTLASVFRLGNNSNKAAEEINAELLRILKQAVESIENALDSAKHINKIPRVCYEDEWDEAYEYYKPQPARFNEGLNYFTHVHVEFKDMSWFVKEPKSCHGTWVRKEWETWLQDESREPATAEWMELVGMEPGACTVHGELQILPPVAEVPRRAGLSKQHVRFSMQPYEVGMFTDGNRFHED